MYLIFDTETTGLPKSWTAPISDVENWPRCVQIAWQLHDDMGRLSERQDFLITPEGYDIPFESQQIHGISTALAEAQGVPISEALNAFISALSRTSFVVGHNVGFDCNIIGAELHRLQIDNPLLRLPVLDTCTEQTATLCQIPGGRGGRFKLPTLTELHAHLFGSPFEEAHNATADVAATTRCFLELVRNRVFSLEELKAPAGYFEALAEVLDGPVVAIEHHHQNLKDASARIAQAQKQTGSTPGSDHLDTERPPVVLQANTPFVHLHNHSQFSVLQSTASIKDLVQAAAQAGMPAVGLTDQGNLMGAFHFVKAVKDYNSSLPAEPEADDLRKPLKPILGCALQVCEDHKNKNQKDNGYQVVFLAKNKKGYENLIKMSSIAYIDGFYYVPRIDKDIVAQYSEGLIVLTGNLYGEVPAKILNVGLNQAEQALLWWKEVFGPNLYLELNRHRQPDEDRVNEVLIEWSKKHDLPLVATNNTYYIQQKDAEAHDVLLCVKDGEKKDTPIGRGRGYRYGLPNDEYYFKSAQEMSALFSDVPEAITNTLKIAEEVESYDLAREVLLPKFAIPEEFQVAEDLQDGGKRGENAYLRHLTYQGAALRYGAPLSESIVERIDFELSIIANSGYPGYFLIVEDFIREARAMGVSVGPGRGSAAGSVVAYCLKITNIDPIKYDLLFERFLNPDRVSMPDIDIDFDDEGRGKVMDYVIQKYGASQVAQIVTYGTMAAKSSIRDTARVLDLPLSDADRLAKLIPNMSKLDKIFSGTDAQLKEAFRSEDYTNVMELIDASKQSNLQGQTLRMAQVLEGSLRNTGIHACGVIITPDDITKFVPVATAKDSDLYVTQFDNSVVESAGLLKMDFLGLKTLTLIKDTVKIVQAKHGIALDPDSFPLDDEKTYELFQKGETVGIFQYESPGMQKHLKDLKPTVFDDLIAMNALYRPGPLEYIPSFIARKHGREPIIYDLPEMEDNLKETYGITVYQEQVMLLSQRLAGFTKGEADVLRKAMGKKIFALLEKLKPKFIEGGQAKGHPAEVLEKIWKDWEAFASYAFNKSHSTCYAYIAYQTAYLKAHYPAEYMAAVLSNNMNDIKQVTFFMEECRRMGLHVLGPDVNESYYKFAVNAQNAIRFGMGAIKGVGRAAVETIVDERKNNGPFRSVFDLAKRIDLRAANKKAFENLAYAGGFDSFGGVHRAQYFDAVDEGVTFLEKVMRYGAKFQENLNSAQVSLFGDASEVQIPEPQVPPCLEWGTMEKLKREREVVGIYLSGHPLDDYKHTLSNFCNAAIGDFQDLSTLVNREFSMGGVVTAAQHFVARNGKGWGSLTLEDYNDTHEFRLYGEEYLKFKHFFNPNEFLFIRVSVREGWVNRDTQQQGEPRIQFQQVMLLQDVLSQLAKKLTLNIRQEDITPELTQKLKGLIDAHPGDKPVQVVVFDQEEEVKLHLSSRRLKVDVQPQLLDALAESGVVPHLK